MYGKKLPQAKTSKIGITAFLNQENVKKQLNQAVGKSSMRFVSSVVSAVTNTPTLQECTNQSILSAALLGESLNLSPSPQLGQYYMVPYENKKVGIKVAQFQMGYKGYIQLAIRSGQYKKLNVLAIKEGELIRFDPLAEEIDVRLIEDEEEREHAKTIGYYAMFEYTNGFKKAIYWSKKKMAAHAEKYSAAFSKNGGLKSLELLEQDKIPPKDMWKYSSFWFKDFDGMAYKTMLRQLISKWGIMSIEMQRAYEGDMAEVHEDGTKQYVDNQAEGDVVEDIYVDATVADGAEDAFAQEGHGEQQQLDLGGGADETK